MLIMAALTGIYLLLGGYVATAINDLIQGIIMILGIILMGSLCCKSRKCRRNCRRTVEAFTNSGRGRRAGQAFRTAAF